MRSASWLLALMVLAHCSHTPTESERLQRIRAEADLALPEGVRLLQFSEQPTVVDPVWAAKLSLPSGAAAAFGKQLLDKRADATQVENAYRSSLPWWRPTRASVTKQYAPRPQTLVSVVVAREGQRDVVYVECMVY